MPSDIRSFFGGKSSQGVPSSQEKTPKPSTKAETKPKTRGKRKVVSDSEDEEEEPQPKKVTATKILPKKSAKTESPKGETTTSSDYFGTKSKPARSTQVTSKSAPKKNESPTKKPTTPKKAEPIKATPKSTPKATNGSAPASARSQRTSTRRAAQKNYAEIDEDDASAVKKDDDSGEDIFGAEFKGTGRKKDDDYESDESEDEVLPTRGKNTNTRKRKSVELEDDEEEEEPTKKTKAAKPTPKKPPPKKQRSPVKKKAEEPEDTNMQDIFDSIPQVRPPTPPPRDDSKKFDWKANAARSQPAPMAGTKEIPEGAENCLAGLTFVFTGILAALGREEGQDLVKRYGGKVTTSPSSKTDYVVLGSDAGPKKLETIAKLKIKTIDEDGLFALISKLPADGGSGKNAAKAEEKRQAEAKKVEAEAKKMDLEMKKADKEQTKSAPNGKSATTDTKIDDKLWTTKYAPTSTTQICGNKTQVEKLQNWLRNWKKSAASKFKKGGPDGAGFFRAAILHGGPGIGKTTAAHLVAKMEGYDVVESNASDTRSKKLIETGLKGVLDTTSLLGYFAGDGKSVESAKKNLVLIMDEVDGMSAGDRGGVGAMAAICRKSSIPIILICNDRKLPKMKPFDKVVYELPFRKPTVDQVRGRIMTILYREGMRDMIPASVVNSLIEGSNADIRRIINMISTAKVDSNSMDFQEGKKMVNAWEKHVILKPWDITQKILGGGMFASSSKSTLNDKIELYFNDHEFSSLMLQENYLKTNPIEAHGYQGRERSLKLLELADQAAESISDGDLCDRMIHGSQQQWSLMPAHAIFSFVRPASFVAGSLGGGDGVRFTSWLGNNSKTQKLSRFVKEIQSHMRLRSAADRHEVRQQYLPVLWTRLVKGLELHGDEPDGVDNIIDLMDSYFLTKDDWDAIYELGLGPQAVEKVTLSTANKTRFTRKYNAMSHPLPFMKASGQLGPVKKGKDKPDLEEAIEESEDEELVVDNDAAESDEELDLKKDKYVQAPKKKKATATKGKAKKGKAVKDDYDDEQDEESEEDVKPKKGKGKASTTKGKVKK